MSRLEGKTPSESSAKTMMEVFQEVVKNHGESTALIEQTTTDQISFQQLDTLSTKIAKRIHKLIVEMIKSDKNYSTDTAVIAMNPSMERIAVILGLWKLNYAYVPVESSVPRQRIKVILSQVKPLLVITDELLKKEKFDTQAMYSEGVNLVITYGQLMKRDEGSLPKTRVIPSDTACILYTSGSTGKPKGVMLTNDNILTRLRWQFEQFPFTSTDIGLAKTSLLFVDSITELFTFLLQGRPIVILKDGKDIQTIVKTITEYKVTRLVLVPSLLGALISYVKMTSTQLLSLNHVICSGEILPVNLGKEFFQVFKDKTLMNFYGSTEVTGDATFAVYEHDVVSRNNSASIGVPIDGVTIEVVQDGRIVELGEVGEIVVKGRTVMKGYVGEEPCHQIYRTGDFGKIIDGQLYYTGRHDDQIKILGNRVNITEMQTLIQTEAQIPVAVLVFNAESSHGEIVAFAEGDAEAETRVREICEANFPDYIIPKILTIDKIPLADSTHKLDREKLKRIYENSRKSSDYSITDAHFLEVLAQELDLNPDEINASELFVNLGGNSVNKVQIASILSENTNLNFAEFMKADTIRAMHACTTSKSITADPENRYEVIPVDENSPHEDILWMLTSAFTVKDPLIMACDFKPGEFTHLIRFNYIASHKDNAAFVIREKSSREIVAAILCYDIATVEELKNLPPTTQLLVDLLNYALEGFEGSVPEGEPVFESFCFGTSRRNTTDENLTLTILAETHAIEEARKRGFYAIQALNSSPVTQMVTESLGYVTKRAIRLQDYVTSDGHRPFHDTVPSDAFLKAQIKFLRE